MRAAVLVLAEMPLALVEANDWLRAATPEVSRQSRSNAWRRLTRAGLVKREGPLVALTRAGRRLADALLAAAT